jgi:hypothetical protein
MARRLGQAEGSGGGETSIRKRQKARLDPSGILLSVTTGQSLIIFIGTRISEFVSVKVT